MDEELSAWGSCRRPVHVYSALKVETWDLDMNVFCQKIGCCFQIISPYMLLWAFFRALRAAAITCNRPILLPLSRHQRIWSKDELPFSENISAVDAALCAFPALYAAATTCNRANIRLRFH